PGRDEAAAEAGEHLLVEEDRRRSGDALVDDQTDRVRPDVDNGQRPAVGQPALGVSDHALPAWAAFFCRLNCAIRFGACDFRASPRPDRLGFVMKYSWALKGSSP